MKPAHNYFLMVCLALTPGLASAADTALATANAAPTNSPAPVVRVGKDVFDFGRVSSGERITNEFVFTNSGAAALIISNVTPACHCTSAGAWTREVQPGKTGIIPLVLDSTGFFGPITRTVSVTCNDPRHPIFSLTMRGTVWRPIEITPVNAIFSLASDVETVEPVVLHITNNFDQPVTLSEPECPNQAFSAELKTIQPGKEFALTVKLKTPINPTSVSAMITMKTSSPRVPVLNASAFAIVRPAINIVPAQINLLPGPLAIPTTNVVTIINSSTNHGTLALTELSGPTNGVSVQMKEIQPGRQYALTVGFPAGYQAPPGGPVEITVKSSHPQYKLIKIPIMQPAAPLQPAFAAPKPMPQPRPPISAQTPAVATPKPAQQPLTLPTPSSNGPPLPPVPNTAAKGQ